MITVTKSLDESGKTVIDQSMEDILGQLNDNMEPLTVEFAQDVFQYIVMPEMMKKMGYSRCNDGTFVRTHFDMKDFSLISWSI